MKKWLEKIKKKSDYEKQIIAFWTAVSITLIIFSVWLLGTIYSLDDKFSNTKNTASPIDIFLLK